MPQENGGEPTLRAAPTLGIWTHSLCKAAESTPGDSRLITLPKVTQVVSGTTGVHTQVRL